MNRYTGSEKQINILELLYDYNNTFNSSWVKRQTLTELENLNFKDLVWKR